MSSWTNTAAREFLRPHYYCPGIADRLSVDRSGDAVWIPLLLDLRQRPRGYAGRKSANSVVRA